MSRQVSVEACAACPRGALCLLTKDGLQEHEIVVFAKCKYCGKEGAYVTRHARTYSSVDAKYMVGRFLTEYHVACEEAPNAQLLCMPCVTKSLFPKKGT